MLLNSRSCTHHPHMHYSYTGGRCNNMPFHLDSPKNVLLLHWEKTPKLLLIGYPPNKCSKFLLQSLKIFVAEKKHEAMQKLFIKNGQVSKISKTMGNQMPAQKKEKAEKMNKIAHVFLQSCFQVSRERFVFKEHSRNRLATIYISSTHAHLDLII